MPSKLPSISPPGAESVSDKFLREKCCPLGRRVAANFVPRCVAAPSRRAATPQNEPSRLTLIFYKYIKKEWLMVFGRCLCQQSIPFR